jgi:hypothetical protein
VISFVATGWFAYSMYRAKQELKSREEKRDTARAVLLGLCDDNGKEEMIEDIVHLCEVAQLEEIVAEVKKMPLGRRKLEPIYDRIMAQDEC